MLHVERARQADKGLAMSRISAFLRTAVSVGLIVLLVIELLLWVVVPLADPYATGRSFSPFIRSQHHPNAEVRIRSEPGLPGMQGVARWTTNNFGFRGDDLVQPKPENEYRIFLIGGSTMECLILDDQDSIDAVVQQNVQQALGSERVIKVYNAGISGDRSDDHVAILSQRIVHLQPDALVVFAGINDLRAGIEAHDYLHFPTPAPAAWRLLVTQTQVGRLAYYLATLRPPALASAAEGPIETAYRVGVELQQSTELASTPPVPNVDAYANNLRSIAGIALGHDIPLILMTQQTTWNSPSDSDARDWHWLLRVGDVRYSEIDMDRALEAMNDAVRDVAETADISLYDLAMQMPKSADFFYDDVHFNTRGARVAGMELSELIIQRINEDDIEAVR